MLYPENHRYLSDLLAYVAVGARSAEDQQHRLTASGLDVPVGMKNPTGGDLTVMINSIKAAHASHTFIYRGWEVKSAGNPFTHAILRGYVDFAGKSVSNYHYEDLVKLNEIYNASGLNELNEGVAGAVGALGGHDENVGQNGQCNGKDDTEDDGYSVRHVYFPLPLVDYVLKIVTVNILKVKVVRD